jgi:hypothetical protein
LEAYQTDLSGLYAVSNLGRVKTLAKPRRYKHWKSGEVKIITAQEKVLKGAVDKLGYVHFRLVKDGKATLIKGHHIVAETFLGYDRKQYDRKNNESLVVVHKDRNHRKQSS